MIDKILIILLVILGIFFGKDLFKNDSEDTDDNENTVPDDPIEDDNEDQTPVKDQDELLSKVEVESLDTVEVLARTLYGEGRGTSNKELYRIGEVILNRKNDYRFPNNIKGVCLQKYQFSCWNSLYKDVLKNNHKVVRQRQISTPRFIEMISIAEKIIYNNITRKMSYRTLFYFIPETSDRIENKIIVDSNDDWKIGLRLEYIGDPHYFFLEN